MRDATKIYDDLLNLNADEWNTILSKELNLPIKHIKGFITSRTIKKDENRTKIELNKNKLKDVFKKIKSRKSPKKSDDNNQMSIMDKYVISFSENEEIITSLACVGKIIVGLDFSNSLIEESYLCHCVFYNCKFNNSNLGDSVINSCIFNSCDFTKADFTSAAMARNQFIECELKATTFDYTVLSDNVIIGCNFSNSSFIQSKILYTGFSECNCEKTDWKDVDWIQNSLSSVILRNSDFRRAKIVDSILLGVDLSNCDFNSFITSSITCACCIYDKKHHVLFKGDDVYNPSTFEWVDEENSEENAKS
jgi:uncharacterized protein YjbI with pentapeptide repeats